jgi:mRNA-degrading endonuclease toxin of MazEF toxin-antitoxin module
MRSRTRRSSTLCPVRTVNEEGDIWTVSGGRNYAGKPRPVVIVQDDAFDATDSVTICAFTTDPAEAPLFRLAVEPNERNGLRSSSRLMVDKITTVPKLTKSAAASLRLGLRGRWTKREQAYNFAGR